MTPGLVEIASDYLKEHGYDGLVNEVCECGCDLHELIACSDPSFSCSAAYKFCCYKCAKRGECAWLGEWPDTDYMMSTNKSFCQPQYTEDGGAR